MLNETKPTKTNKQTNIPPPKKKGQNKQTKLHLCFVFYYIIIYYICTIADFIQVKQDYCLLLMFLNSVFVERATVLPV